MPRRSQNADGSIYKYTSPSGKSYWRAQLWVRTNAETGKPKRVSKAGIESKAEAKKVLENLRLARNSHRVVDDGDSTTVAEYASAWLSASVHLEGSTIHGYDKYLRLHILPFVGHLSLSKVQRQDMKGLVGVLLNYKTNGLSVSGKILGPNTVRKVMNLCFSMFSDAKKEGLLAENPVEGVRLPKLNRPDTQQKIWTSDELREFLEWNKRKGDDLNPLWQLIAYTGLRRSEALALTWRAIDFEKSRVNIYQAVDTSKSRAIKSTKTSSSKRVLDVDSDLMSVLADYKRERTLLGDDFVRPESFVFANMLNQLRVPNDVSARWARQVKAFERQTNGRVKRVTLHSLRHAHATHLMEMGIHAKTIQRRLGHSSFRTTMDLYSHVTPEMEKGVIQAISRMKTKNKHNIEHTEEKI